MVILKLLIPFAYWYHIHTVVIFVNSLSNGFTDTKTGSRRGGVEGRYSSSPYPLFKYDRCLYPLVSGILFFINIDEQWQRSERGGMQGFVWKGF